MKDNEQQEKTSGVEGGAGPEDPGRPGGSGGGECPVAAAPSGLLGGPVPAAGYYEGQGRRGDAEIIPQAPGESPGILELIYGILFDPVRTYRRISFSPPAGKVLIIFTIVKGLSILVFVLGGVFFSNSMFNFFPGREDQGIGALKAVAPAVTVLGMIYEYLKWFVYSGILYLLAGLFGGRGSAAGVLAVTGLASLPALIILPLQMLMVILGGGGWMSGPAGVLFWLATLIWGTVLVVIGIRETQQLSTGRAVAVAFTPAAGLVVVFILLLALLVSLAAPLSSLFHQFDDISF